MSAPVSSIVQVSISQSTQAVQQQSFSTPALFGPSNRFTPTTTTGATTNGSSAVTLASATGVSKGQRISGVGIPAGATIISVTGLVVQMSVNATATGAGVTITTTDCIRGYTSLAGMLSDGYLITDPEYVRAAELMSQPLQPTIFYVGYYYASVVQVTTVTPDVSSQTIQHYIETIAGVPYDFTSDSSPTAAEVVTGLVALINADPNAPVVASGSTTLLLTAKVAGAGFTHSETSNLAAVDTTPNHSIVSGIQNAQAQPGGDNWYGLTICSQIATDIEQVAAYIESQLKILVADSNDANILTSSTTDVASVLQAKSYKRTALLYGGVPNDGRAAAWLGGQLPQVPGASTWKFKTLGGVSTDTLTAAQRLTCVGVPGTPGKNCNIYETVGGVGITEEGFTSSGQFIDVTVGLDWLSSQLQTNVFSQLVNSPKVPYTNAGIAVIQNAVLQALRQGAANGLIDRNSIVVTVPDVLSIPTNSRATRVLASITFTCRLAGAFHFIQIQGTVTV